MRKTAFLNGFLPQSARELRNGIAVFACVLCVTVGGAALRIGGVSAAAGQILKIAASDGGTTFYVGRCFRTNFNIQTDNLDANSVDLIIPYNPAYIQPFSNSGCTSVATQIITHSLFPSYPSNTIVGNEILVTGYDPSGSAPVDTGTNPAHRTIGYVFWKVIAASGSYNLGYTHTLGLTTDTNIAENNGDGSDVLDAVENATFNLSADVTVPTFASLSPANGATSVSVTSGLSYVFADAGAGVNTGSLVTSVNGTPYTETFSSCTRTNSNRRPQCNVSVPTGTLGTLSYNTTYRVTATGSDVAVPNNTGATFWSFTTEDDTNAPYVQNESPANNATGVAVASNIVFNVKDYKGNLGVTPGLGVDTSSIQVTVTVGNDAPVVYTSSSPEFSISGIAANRTVTINPASNFPENTLVTVSVEASDLHSPANVMSTHTYSFRSVDTQGPSLSGFSPAQNATTATADTNISFTASDAGAGVNINNTTVTVEGVAYTYISPQFSYTGNSGSYIITINPTSNFSGGQVVDVTIATRDLASPTPNQVSTSYSFTVANNCVTCSVDGEDPERFTQSADLDDTIVFHVKDTSAGINEDSIRITLIGSGSAIGTNPLVLTGSSPLVNIAGTSADYTVTITLTDIIEENIAYSIMIEATDINGLDMSTVAYTFMNLNVGSGGGSSSSAASSSSSAVSCPACNCPAVTSTDEEVQSGGGRRTTQTTIDNLNSSELPTIIRRRKLPDGSIVEEVLTPQEAGAIGKCYIDENSRPAAAKPLTHYEDIAPGAWYEAAVADLLKRGVLDATQNVFRANDSAVRAEFAKVLVKLRNIANPVAPATPNFDDADPLAWYYPFVEESAKRGWMKGYNNCYGTRPCTVMPGSPTTRAEAIAMIVRYYGLDASNRAPRFMDVPEGAWYAAVLQAAADRCIVQGDDLTGLVAPDRIVNRAEMVTLFARAQQNLKYGKDCGPVSQQSGLGASLLSNGSGGPQLPLLGLFIAFSCSAAACALHAFKASKKKQTISIRKK